MTLPSTLFLALTACLVGLSVGLPGALDNALKVLAKTDLELKGFYKALATHDFAKAGELYDKIAHNKDSLVEEETNIAQLKVPMGLETERFKSLAEVQIKVLIEKLGAIVNKEKELDSGDKKDDKPKKKEETPKKEKKPKKEETPKEEEKKKDDSGEEADDDLFKTLKKNKKVAAFLGSLNNKKPIHKK